MSLLRSLVPLLVAVTACVGDDSVSPFDSGADGVTSDATSDSTTDASDSSTIADASADAPVDGSTGPGKRVFVTSVTYKGNIGGLTAADTKCQGVALNAGLVGTFLAWIATVDGGSPQTRFAHSTVPYKRIDGVTVANNWTQLTSGTLLNPIDVTEDGGPLATSVLAWTNTMASGAAWEYDCAGWTVSDNTANGRLTSVTTNSLAGTQISACYNDGLLICVEQ